MSKVMLRNISPLGYVDVPQIGRVGDSPTYEECLSCAVEHDPDHEHQLVDDPEAGEPGVGCLIPGEEFEVSAEMAEFLLQMPGTFELAEPDDGLGDLTIKELRAHAAEHEIDLGKATSKKAILAAIRKG